MKQLLATVLMIGMAAGPALSEATPARGQFDPRVREATYQDGQVYRLRVSTLRVTTVEFGQSETISSILAGDTAGFEFDALPGGTAFAIKPLASGVSTNVTVRTNRRSYYFWVTEGGDPVYFTVRFNYPGERAEQRPIFNTPARDPHTAYSASARQSSISPRRVWDDGRFTYFQFAGEVPAIFAVTSDSRERTVNTQVQERGIVRATGVYRYWVLRAGNTEVTVRRD